MPVTHVGTPYAPIARILDAHLPRDVEWHVTWAGESASVETSCGSLVIESGRAWGPYYDGVHMPDVLHAAMRGVRGPLTDRLIARMCGMGE